MNNVVAAAMTGYLIKVVGPSLHHFSSIIEELGTVISNAL